MLLAQTYWHGLYFRNLDLFAGTVMYMGSTNQVDATGFCTRTRLWAFREMAT